MGPHAARPDCYGDRIAEGAGKHNGEGEGQQIECALSLPVGTHATPKRSFIWTIAKLSHLRSLARHANSENSSKTPHTLHERPLANIDGSGRIANLNFP